MKKKLITLLSLFVMTCFYLSFLNAQTGVTLLDTNFEDWKPTISTDQANGTYSVPNATLKIQGPRLNNSSTPNAGTNTSYPNYFRFGSDGSTTNQYIEITPDGDFINGGKVTVILSSNTNPSDTYFFYVADSEAASVSVSNTFAGFNQIGRYTHTEFSVILPESYLGKKTLRFFRLNTTTFLFSVKIETNPQNPVISNFNAAGVDAEINQTTKAIQAELPYGTNLNGIEPDVTIGGPATSYSPTGPQDFTNSVVMPVIYTVTDGVNNVQYAVTLTTSATPSSEKKLLNVILGSYTPLFDAETSTYSLTLPKTASLLQAVNFDISVAASADFTSGNTHDFNNPLSITVTAQDASTKIFTLQAVNGIADIAYVVDQAISTNDTKVYPMLKSKGYYLGVIPATGTDLTQFNAYDLVVLNEETNSANTLLAAMGQLIGVKPLLNFKAYMYGRTNWPTGAGYNGVSDKSVLVEEAYLQHPVFDGVTIEENLLQILNTGISGNGIQAVTNPGSGNVIAKLPSRTADATIIEKNEVATSKYLLIPIANVNYANVSDNGLKLIENAVAYLLSNDKFITTGNLQPMASRIFFDGHKIHNQEGEMLKVYDTTGRLVVSSSEDIQLISFNRGVYIIRSEKGGIMKIVY